MIIKYYKKSFKLVIESISRFLGAFISSVLLFIVSSYMVIYNDHGSEVFRILYCLVINISCFILLSNFCLKELNLNLKNCYCGRCLLLQVHYFTLHLECLIIIFIV